MPSHPRLPHRRLLAHALSLALFSPLPLALAAPATDSHPSGKPQDLDAVVVTASPLKGTIESLAAPVDVLTGQALDRAKSSTLGDTVDKLPGVQSTYFGTGVGRPIIRGQEGPRVQVLSGGLGSMDASAVSADHAISIEPFLADQIEVLKGPATLLFGSGAVGGAVNVVDGRLHDTLPDTPLSGRVEVRGNTVNDERSGMFRLDGVNGSWVVHVDGLMRDTGDYNIPGVASIAPDDGNDHAEEPAQIKGRLPNSAVKTRAGAIGATWLGEQAYFGLAASTYRSNYGIPAGAHTHSGSDDHDHSDAGEAGPVRIDMAQDRIDLKAGLYTPLPFLQAINLRGAYNDYQHVELENSLPATRFGNRGRELRLEAVQTQHHGWRGAFGLHYGRSDFSAIGEEAFVPSTLTDTLGLFVLQEKTWGDWKMEFGGRHEQVKLKPQQLAQRDFHITSLSGAAIWQIAPTVDLRLGLDHSERAPSNEELFAAGPHVATQSVEIGNARLDKERGRHAELGLHAHAKHLELKLAAYQTRFKDFIYLADTGVVESLPVRLWTQQDATFTGLEAEAQATLADSDLAGLWKLRLFGDTVRAQLDGHGSRQVDLDVPHDDHAHTYTVTLAQGGNLPRIAPSRVGADLDWTLAGWSASMGAVYYAKQNKVAQNELPSPAYTLVNAHLSYRWDLDAASWEIFLDGSNLSNRQARPHTSLLRQYAPLPGRGVAFGIRAYF